MIIQLQPEIEETALSGIRTRLAELNLKTRAIQTQKGKYLVCLGNFRFDIRELGALEGVRDIHRVSDNYKLVSAKWKVERTVIDLGDGVTIGGESPCIMAGPCSIEGEAQILDTVQALKDNNIRIMRGGVFKPRSSPYSFRGLGLEGLKTFHRLCHQAGIKIITEVMEEAQIELMYDYVDVFQVGARNAQNYNLLDALGKVDKPVMLKRGISGSIDELLYSAEYVFSGGNERLILCERGIRTYERSYRNTLDLNAIPILKMKSHLPVIADPSHGVGIRECVPPMALAAIAAGADGVIIEAHRYPQKALSDADQTIDFDTLSALTKRIRQLEKLSWR